MKIFNHFGTIEFISGSTLPPILVRAKSRDSAGKLVPADTSGMAMRCIVAKAGTETIPVDEIECTATADGFQCHITSKKTSGWAGVYKMHFALYDSTGLVHRNLYGVLDVIPAPEGGVV